MAFNLSVFPIAPSSPFDRAGAALGVALLRANGFDVLHEPKERVFAPGYLNGSDAQRLGELHEALNSKSDLLWMARGGYGLTRLTPALELPETKTPVLVGFSDATALHCHLWRHKKQKGVHASNLTRLSQESADSLGILWSILSGNAKEIHWPALRKVWWPHGDTLEGPLLVTNLCMLTHLIGTSSMPDLAGSILVIEEIGERPYRIDRMLTQLWNSGSLKGVRAIVTGQFTSCDEPSDSTITPRSVILERCQAFGIPVCEGLPVGHDIPNWAIPFGARASLTPVGESLQLRILEEIF